MMTTNGKKVEADMAAQEDKKKKQTTGEFWREPLDDAVLVKKEGKIHVLKNRCKGCGFCVEFCPKKVLVMSEEINEKGYHPPDVLHLEACVYCELCELVCPDFAIYIEVTKSNEKELEKKKSPKD